MATRGDDTDPPLHLAQPQHSSNPHLPLALFRHRHLDDDRSVGLSSERALQITRTKRPSDAVLTEAACNRSPYEITYKKSSTSKINKI
ncbi:hypothetical protein [Acidisphaera sp. S103]|uniref:hypothetical protein n=1 Tax=Acidisphaera sp. S103 TaxID=1747223 RepID=UPI00131D1C5F|nr:hypothetical protein [Acidisphaera sp. S103]